MTDLRIATLPEGVTITKAGWATTTWTQLLTIRNDNPKQVTVELADGGSVEIAPGHDVTVEFCPIQMMQMGLA